MYSTVLTCTVLSHGDADSCEAAALFSCTKCTVLQCTPLYRPAVQTGFRVMQQLYLAVRKSTAMY